MFQKLTQAFEFANKVHEKQKRKGTDTPYISHVMSVSSMVLEMGGSLDSAIAALLHDVVEDSEGKVTVQMITDQFGAKVSSMVATLTDATTFPKKPWKQRKDHYLKNLEQADEETKLIAACDKWHNLSSLLRDLDDQGDEVWEKFSSSPEEQLWYYKSVFNCVEEAIPFWLAEQLGEGIEYLEEIISDE